MDYHHEQLQELEVLQSIYPDELTETGPGRFHIAVRLDTPSARVHTAVLQVSYPEKYPDDVPELALDAHSSAADADDADSDEDEEAKRVRVNINLSESIEFSKADLSLLLEKLRQEAELQVGAPAVFAITTQLKDEAEQLFQRKLETLEKKREEEFKRLEAEQAKKFLGTKVTAESFAAWRLKFRHELGIDERIKSFYRAQHNGKLTGREIFEQGLAREEEDELPEALGGLKV